MEADTILIEGRWLMFKNELIGKGGYGKVYKGKDTKTGKEVAIKRINTKEVKVKVHDFSLS
jgi:serine/threonine protein kinase